MKSEPRPPAELYYFAFHPKDWLSSPSVRRMAREDRGDFIDLLCLAWGNGTVEPSLEKDDLSAASTRVKAQFRERSGRFYNEKLSQVWRDGQVRHLQAVKRGKASAKAKRERKRLETVSKQSPTAMSNGGEQRPLSMSIEDHIDPLSRGAGAPASGEAAPAPESSENGALREVRGDRRPFKLTDILPAALRQRPA